MILALAGKSRLISKVLTGLCVCATFTFAKVGTVTTDKSKTAHRNEFCILCVCIALKNKLWRRDNIKICIIFVSDFYTLYGRS